MSEAPRLFRKYANRRFYDPATHKYATLDDMLSEVVAGGSVLVRNHCGQDITVEVLLAGLLQQQKNAGRNNPLHMPIVLEAQIREAHHKRLYRQ